jgi:transcriptional regulator with XRE-family HTH domain
MIATEEETVRRLEKLCNDLDVETLQLIRLRKEIRRSIKNLQRNKKLLGDAEAGFREVDLDILQRFLEISRDNCRREVSIFDERLAEIAEEKAEKALIKDKEKQGHQG